MITFHLSWKRTKEWNILMHLKRWNSSEARVKDSPQCCIVHFVTPTRATEKSQAYVHSGEITTDPWGQHPELYYHNLTATHSRRQHMILLLHSKCSSICLEGVLCSASAALRLNLYWFHWAKKGGWSCLWSQGNANTNDGLILHEAYLLSY